MNKMSTLKLIDIGANLVDQMYSGVYHGSKKHEADLQNVLMRAWDSGLNKIMITGVSLEESEKALSIAELDDRLYATVGCHPTNCNEIATAPEPSAYVQKMADMCRQNKTKVVAVGEFGLDYDRLHFCSKETQLRYFEEQLIQFSDLSLPLFLHCRNAAEDLFKILTRHRDSWTSGVIHSFDGTEDDVKQILDLGLHIGINGCSLKNEENLQVVKSIPSDRLLLETDSPWCEIRPTHAGFKYIRTKFTAVKKEKWALDCMIKGRNEPATIRQVLEVIAGVREDDIESLGEQIYNNTNKLFFSCYNVYSLSNLA